MRLPDGLPVGRNGLAPGAGFSGASTAPTVTSSPPVTPRSIDDLRRLSTRRVWFFTRSVRSRIDTDDERAMFSAGGLLPRIAAELLAH